MKVRKLRYILKDSGACALITHLNKSMIVEPALQDGDNITHLVWYHSAENDQITGLRNSNSNLKTEISWYSIFKNSDISLKTEKRESLETDLATIIYTSGSTGNPKGVMSAHYNMVFAAKSITTYLENTEDDIILCALPLSFDYGLYQIIMTFMFGGTVVLERSFLYPYRIFELIFKHRVTGFPLVPTVAGIILEMERLPSFKIDSIRYVSSTASAFPPVYIRKLRKIWRDAKIYSMYGLTECKRVSYLPPEDIDSRPGSVGIPMPGTEVFVVDKNGDELGFNQVGELVVKGPHVMQGYWNDLELTKRIFRKGNTREEARLYTGDLFKKDEKGYLYFVARKDDLIKTKGERVSPKEVENVLCDLAGVVETAVIGIPDLLFGQSIKAYIVTNKNGPNEKMVQAHCRRKLEPFMIPQQIVIMDSLPKLTNGKIDKKKLQRF